MYKKRPSRGLVAWWSGALAWLGPRTAGEEANSRKSLPNLELVQLLQKEPVIQEKESFTPQPPEACQSSSHAPVCCCGR